MNNDDADFVGISFAQLNIIYFSHDLSRKSFEGNKHFKFHGKVDF